jgi:hypothetical protein
MVHSGSPSLHTTLGESSNKDDATSGTRGGGGGEFGIPWPLRVQCGQLHGPRHRHTSSGECSGSPNHPDSHGAEGDTPAEMELLPDQQQPYQKEQQVRARQVDAERWATQSHNELAGEQATLGTEMTELH